MIPPRIVLDTSAYSHLARGHPGVLEWLSTVRIVYVPATVLGELEAGFRLGERAEANLRQLSEFLSEPFVVIVQTDHEVAAWYGRILPALRRAGTPIPTNDIWIAAATRAMGAHLLTFDGDFSRVVDLPLTILTP